MKQFVSKRCVMCWAKKEMKVTASFVPQISNYFRQLLHKYMFVSITVYV